MNVDIGDIIETEETQFGVPVPRRMDQSAPTDFSFMMEEMARKEAPKRKT